MTIEKQLEQIADNLELLKEHFLNPPMRYLQQQQPSLPTSIQPYGKSPGMEALPRILKENEEAEKPKKKKKSVSKRKMKGLELEEHVPIKSSPKITKDTMMDELRELMAVKDGEAVKSILAEFGAKNTAEVAESDYEACFNRACQELGKSVNG